MSELYVRVDGLVWLKVERHFLFLAFVREDRADEQHQAIRGNSIVQFETLLSTRDSGQDRETVNAGFDVGGSSVFLR